MNNLHLVTYIFEKIDLWGRWCDFSPLRLGVCSYVLVAASSIRWLQIADGVIIQIRWNKEWFHERFGRS